MKKGRVAVFLSGRGSNFISLYRASIKSESNFTIALVISDRKNAPGLKAAGRLRLPAFHVSPHPYSGKEEYENELIRLCREYDIELICLAGYMRLVGERLLSAYPSRVLNIHPALLPAFPGLHAQRQALAYGAKVSGCTVHFVDSGVDTGPVILQHPVVIAEGDNEDTLSRRILRHEHRIYPQAVHLFFAGRLHREGRHVIIEDR